MTAADGDYVERTRQWYVVVSDFTDERDLMDLTPYDSPEAALVDARDRTGVDGLERRVEKVTLTLLTMSVVRG